MLHLGAQNSRLFFYLKMPLMVMGGALAAMYAVQSGIAFDFFRTILLPAIFAVIAIVMWPVVALNSSSNMAFAVAQAYVSVWSALGLSFAMIVLHRIIQKKWVPHLAHENVLYMFSKAYLLFLIVNAAYNWLGTDDQSWFASSTLYKELLYPLSGVLFMASLVFALLGLTSLVYFGTRNWWWQSKQHHLPKMTERSLMTMAILLFLLVMASVIWEMSDEVRGNQYFKLHAAIQNTCLIDPARQNCPQTLEELSFIEPQAFSQAQESADLLYRYYPERNEYTLIVRYAPHRAAVFDPRFKAIYGIDYHEFNVSQWGRDRLLDAPKLPGPWAELSDW